MTYLIRELRDTTGMTQKEFANMYKIPLSTLRKWEQGEASPAPYVMELIARTIPCEKQSMMKIVGDNETLYYFDRNQKKVSDVLGNSIIVQEDLTHVKQENLKLYIQDLFESFYEIQAKFNRDCKYDREEDIIWTR